jgi:hypothetical protein
MPTTISSFAAPVASLSNCHRRASKLRLYSEERPVRMSNVSEAADPVIGAREYLAQIGALLTSR